MKTLASILILVMLAATNGFAQPGSKRKQAFNVDKSGLAIDGYDPVAYFSGSKAMPGKTEISTVYNGIIYRFATVPQKYQPNTHPHCHAEICAAIEASLHVFSKFYLHLVAILL